MGMWPPDAKTFSRPAPIPEKKPWEWGCILSKKNYIISVAEGAAAPLATPSPPSSYTYGGATEHLIDSSKTQICRLNWVCMLPVYIKSHSELTGTKLFMLKR